MNYDSKKHHRKSIRLKGHDYAGGGLYFVTFCTHRRQQLFGRMAGGGVQLSEAGHIAEQCWTYIPEHFPQAEPGPFVVMPDHVHGIIRMVGEADGAVGAKDLSPLQSHRSISTNRPHGTSRTLGSVVRGFKVGVTKWVRSNTDVHDVWLRNYYETIIRTAEAERNITEYIGMNPWRCVQHLGSDLRGIGNPALWNTEKLGICCSRNAPKPSSIPDAAVYIGGFHSPMEKQIFERLLEYKKPLIWCPAWGLGKSSSIAGVRAALEDNRMLILKMKNSAGNLVAARERNAFVMQSADQLWLPHISPGGMLDELVKNLPIQGKRI